MKIHLAFSNPSDNIILRSCRTTIKSDSICSFNIEEIDCKNCKRTKRYNKLFFETFPQTDLKKFESVLKTRGFYHKVTGNKENEQFLFLENISLRFSNEKLQEINAINQSDKDKKYIIELEKIIIDLRNELEDKKEEIDSLQYDLRHAENDYWEANSELRYLEEQVYHERY